MSDLSAFAPGRIELLGNHTDYNGGIVLSTAIPMGVTARGRGRTDGKILLASEGMDGLVEADCAGTLKPRGGWGDYPLGAVAMLLQAGYPLAGFEAHFSSTLPVGAGLSSSAALEVATAVLLRKLFPFEISPMDLAKICRRAENEFVGVSCGLLDQVSSIFGKKDHAVYLDCRAETVQAIPFPPHLGLLVVHSGVGHALTGGEYNERRDACFEVAKRLGVPALRDVDSARLAAAGLPDLLRRRAMHVVGENERVTEALACLRSGHGEELGRLMTTSHHSSMDNFENSTPELDILVSLATQLKGCYGCPAHRRGSGGNCRAY